MPFAKAKIYQRFNVGEYMRQRRLGWLAVEKKQKKLKNTAQTLKRLDSKDSKIRFILFLCFGIEYVIFDCVNTACLVRTTDYTILIASVL